MITITSKYDIVGTEHYVLQLGFEPVKINFIQQIDDLLVSSPDEDILIAWDVPEFREDENLLIKPHDNLKELSNLRATSMVLRTREDLGKTIPVWVTVQRN